MGVQTGGCEHVKCAACKALLLHGWDEQRSVQVELGGRNKEHVLLEKGANEEIKNLQKVTGTVSI